MGLFDSLLGLHSNAAGNAATGTAMNYDQAVGAGNAAQLTGYTNLADQYRQQMNTAASNVLNSTYGQAQNALTSAGAQAQLQLAAGVNNAVGTVQGSNAQYAPYVASGQAANGLYADSLGLNGASGNAAATSAFQTSPGYAFQVDQATDAASRKAAALGTAASGGTLAALTTLGSNLADQEYSNWQSKLSGLGAQGLSAANAVSANNQAAAGYQYGGGLQGASLAQQLGGSLANTSTSLGTTQAGLFNGLGSSIAGDQTNLAANLVNNNFNTANAVNGLSTNNAVRQDAATSANNGLFANMIGSIGSGIGSTASGKSILSSLLKL